MSTRQRLIPIGFLFALLFLYGGVTAYYYWSEPSLASFPGWYVRADGRVLSTQFGANESEPALQDGDEIVSLNGKPFQNSSQYFTFFDQAPSGQSYDIEVRRNGQQLKFTLSTKPIPRLLLLLRIFYGLAVPRFIWLITGLMIVILQPLNKQALLLGLSFGLSSMGGDLPHNLIVAHLSWWLLSLMVVTHLAVSASVPMLPHFFLIFPERSSILRRFPQLEWLLYIFWIFGLPFSLVLDYFWIFAPERYFEVPRAFPWLARSMAALLIAYIALALTALIISYRQANESGRRRIRVIVAGTIVGLVPFLSIFLINGFSGNSPASNPMALANILASLMLVLMPLSFAYAIVRHQVIPVSLIVRRSVQYLLAKNGLRVLLALPIIGIVITVAAHPERSIAEVFFRNSIYFYVLLIAAVALGLVFRKRLSEWIDRKFFREAFDQERILRELIDEVRRADSMAAVSKLVCRKVESALHPEHVYLFYRHEATRELSLGYSTAGSTDGLAIPEDFQLLRFMEMQDSAQDFPFPQRSRLPQAEKDWLTRLGAALIVPMTTTEGRLAGLFVLADKRSEIPYTTRDRELLEALADEIAIIHENLTLKARADQDRQIKQDVLARVGAQEFNLLKECPRCGVCCDFTIQLCPNCRKELTPSLPVERTIENRYRLERLLGRGGMGAVYEAIDLRLNRPVAVKILRGSLFGDRQARRRFEHEAKASAMLKHPNIVTVHDYGELRTEGAFLVMELVRGETLRARLKRDRFIHPKIAQTLFDQLLEGIGAAHAEGVVHRDLKPDNLMITDPGNGKLSIKILDFGLAKISQTIILDSQSPTAVAPITEPGVALGTFGYMSPEQLTGGEVDHRSDLFSLGLVIAEALTSQKPFGGATLTELVASVLHGEYHLPVHSSAAFRVDQALQKCLAKDRADRFDSAKALQTVLIPALADCPVLFVEPSAASESETAVMKM